MKQLFQLWLGRSLAIALLVGSGQQAFAQAPVSPLVSSANAISSDLTVAMPDSLEKYHLAAGQLSGLRWFNCRSL